MWDNLIKFKFKRIFISLNCTKTTAITNNTIAISSKFFIFIVKCSILNKSTFFFFFFDGPMRVHELVAVHWRSAEDIWKFLSSCARSLCAVVILTSWLFSLAAQSYWVTLAPWGKAKEKQAPSRPHRRCCTHIQQRVYMWSSEWVREREELASFYLQQPNCFINQSALSKYNMGGNKYIYAALAPSGKFAKTLSQLTRVLILILWQIFHHLTN